MKTLNNLLKLFLVLIIGFGFTSCEDQLETPCVTEAYNIEGWEEAESFTFQFTDNMLNATFASTGEFLYVGHGVPTYQQRRYPLTNAWDIQSINTAHDQLNSSYNVVSWFSEVGDYRYSKAQNSSHWIRQPIHSPFDLTKMAGEDEFNYLTDGDFIYMLPNGQFYGLTGNTIFEYVSSYPEQTGIDVIEETRTVNVNSILPNDGKVLKGLELSDDGTRAFIYKSDYQAPFTASVYQVDLTEAFKIETAVYNNISITFVTTDELNSMQFTSDGEAFITIEGKTNQVIRKFTLICE